MGRRYGIGGPWVLRGVGLDVPAGALLRCTGTNGSGKSTLLRVVAGIDAPSAGKVLGRPRTAYVPERFPAALPFTAAGYLVHLGRIHGLSRSVASARADQWLERFGADGHAGTPLTELSKGTSQKVAVAQALLAEPELLVLDEAWTGLDTAARAELDRAVAERVAAGGAVLFVDHDPRRLAGLEDAVYRVAGDALVRDAGPAGSASVAEAGPCVLIEAEGPPGVALPAGLPGQVAADLDEAGVARLTVPEAQSDVVLRVLLGARPGWHVRRVVEVAGSSPGTASVPSDTSTSGV